MVMMPVEIVTMQKVVGDDAVEIVTMQREVGDDAGGGGVDVGRGW